jgi:transcriptional regulator with XRE-family HTH domain
MNKETLKDWRKREGLTRKKLAGMLGVSPMALAYWEWGSRKTPPLLPLALEALENRMRKEQEHGFTGGVPGVQKAE